MRTRPVCGHETRRVKIKLHFQAWASPWRSGNISARAGEEHCGIWRRMAINSDASNPQTIMDGAVWMVVGLVKGTWTLGRKSACRYLDA